MKKKEIEILKRNDGIPTWEEGECRGGNDDYAGYVTHEPIMVRKYWLKNN